MSVPHGAIFCLASKWTKMRLESDSARTQKARLNFDPDYHIHSWSLFLWWWFRHAGSLVPFQSARLWQTAGEVQHSRHRLRTSEVLQVCRALRVQAGFRQSFPVVGLYWNRLRTLYPSSLMLKFWWYLSYFRRYNYTQSAANKRPLYKNFNIFKTAKYFCTKFSAIIREKICYGASFMQYYASLLKWCDFWFSVRYFQVNAPCFLFKLKLQNNRVLA